MSFEVVDIIREASEHLKQTSYGSTLKIQQLTDCVYP